MRLVVTGRSGQLATALVEQAARLGIDVRAIGRPDFDLEQPQALAARLAAAKPDAVVNAAAYTAVDRAESEPERAFAVNCGGAAAVAAATRELGVPLIHMSTDYVFDGRKGKPYVETDATGPLNAYGRSKLAGERAVLAANPEALILRTSWLFSPFGSNFLKTMLRLGAERPVVRVVDDQIGNPTSALDLASVILKIAPSLKSDAGGIYHVAGEESTSWHAFATLIFTESWTRGYPSPALEAIKTPEYPTPAPRPANSSLDCTAFARRFGVAPRSWIETVPGIVERVTSAEASLQD